MGLELYEPDGYRVHCGTSLRIRVGRNWMWARYEMDPRGDGYWVIDNDRCLMLNDAEEIDWAASAIGRW